MSTRDRAADGETGEGHARPGESEATGPRTYRVVEPMDSAGRMTVRTDDGDRRTVVGYVDDLAGTRLLDRAAGETVRMELSPAPSGTGHLAARVLPGGLPAL